MVKKIKHGAQMHSVRETAEGYVDSPLGDVDLVSYHAQRTARMISLTTSTVPRTDMKMKAAVDVFGLEYSNVIFIFSTSLCFIFIISVWMK